ncbi:MAG: hypothetical protein ACYDBJ_09075 [Aggregatilineales bacterium]
MPETIPEQGTPPESNSPPQDAPHSAPEAKPPFTAFVEHQVNAAHETLEALRGLLPPDFRTHARAARHEFLLSFKVLLEGVTEKVEHEMARVRQAAADTGKKSDKSDDDDDKPSTTGKSKVKVEVL